MVHLSGEAVLLVARAQEFRRHHRRKRQRDDAGNRDRAGQGEGKLAEERAGQTALDADRHINRGERDRHGDDRADELARAEQRGVQSGVSPSRRWRSTFSTTTMASSTTRPTESTIASRVSRLIVKPKTCMRKTAPMSEIGIATIGMMTERHEPRKRKMTMHDDEQRFHQGLKDFLDRGVDVGCAVVGDAALHAGGQFLLDLLHLGPDPLDHVDRVRIGQNENAHEDGALAGEADLGVVIFRAEDHVRDVTQPDETFRSPGG